MKIIMGAFLVTLLFLVTAIGKKVNEPFQSKEIETEKPEVLLDLPLQTKPQAQELNYGALVKYEYRTPLASYEQVTNNKKWTTPENGRALFPPINGTSLYAIESYR
jgi:hypothetical protein